MLRCLRIQNFAIIDSVEIDFGAGLNIISGETGAGKSILMDALFLILGGRASSDLIRSGSDEAVVEAAFDLSSDLAIQSKMHDLGIEIDSEGELIVRRLVHRSGKNRIFANGGMINMNTLQKLTENLVDLCSQHDQQLLSKSEEQLLWLDRFEENEDLRKKINELFVDWKEKERHMQALSTDATQRAQKIDFLKFQIQEISETELNDASEDERLAKELKALANGEALFKFAGEALDLLYGGGEKDSPGLVHQITSLQNKTNQFSLLDETIKPATEFLETLKLNADELGVFLRDYSNRASYDEERIETMNARLAQLASLKRKYGPSLEKVIENFAAFSAELSLLENHESTMAAAEAAEAQSRELYFESARALSEKRKRAASSFAKAVVKELADLQMDRCRFEANLKQCDQPGPYGIDLIQYQIAANPGEVLGPLNKVASGGELSRIMLAIHNVISSRSGVGVYLFDEVDSGIGGKTAVTVGNKLQKVSRANQVICITHLPQVAAFADKHFHVEKKVAVRAGAERTICKVIPLVSKEERELELARMLGGMSTNKAALANARAMLDMAKVSSAPVTAKVGAKNAGKAGSATSASNRHAR